MIFDMMHLSMKRKSRNRRHTLCAPTIRKMQAKCLAFSSGGRSFYIIWLGNEVFANKVSRKAIRILWKERHKLAYMLVIVKIGGKLEVSSYAHLLNSCGHTTHDWFAVLSILGQHMTVIQNKPSNHYNGVPKIRRSGLLSQQQSLNGPSRCRKSSGSWRCEMKFFGTTAR